MCDRRHIGRSLLLASLVLGLNALCLIGWAYGRHAHRHTPVNYTHIPPYGSHRPTARGSRSANNSICENHVSDRALASHIAPNVRPVEKLLLMHGAVAVLSTAPALQPDRTTRLLPYVDTLARGSAPRAPGQSRAPPRA
ncbi:MAG: hypothetical protein JSS87_02340 [Acidobacteria bacterium]|nr:hypothetical protein [Acidobacteriota bacterium]